MTPDPTQPPAAKPDWADEAAKEIATYLQEPLGMSKTDLDAIRLRILKHAPPPTHAEERLREAMAVEIAENMKLQKGTTLFDFEKFVVEQHRRLLAAISPSTTPRP